MTFSKVVKACLADMAEFARQESRDRFWPRYFVYQIAYDRAFRQEGDYTLAAVWRFQTELKQALIKQITTFAPSVWVQKHFPGLQASQVRVIEQLGQNLARPIFPS